MLLELNDITKSYTKSGSRIRAVDGVSLSLDSGQFVAVQGPSGCGKTTLLLVAGGLLHPDGGTVNLAGENPYTMSSEARARFRAKQIGFVFQQFHLVPYLSVRDNVLAPTLALGSADAPARAEELLERFGLTDRQHHTPGELSSGERQRTALARALLNQPKLILADEPTGNLDAENAALVLETLEEFTSTGGGVLLVTHDSSAAARANRIVNLQNGRLVDAPQGSKET